jgi:excisionase family DNA binding protein
MLIDDWERRLKRTILNKLLTVQEVSQILAVSRDFIYVHWRELGGVKIGGLIRFSPQSLEDYVNALQEKTKESVGMVREGDDRRRSRIKEDFNQNRREKMGGRTKKTPKDKTEDRHNLFGLSC